MVSKDEELAEIDALFAQADLDHDGQINFTEFKALVRELDARYDGGGAAHRIHRNRCEPEQPHQHR